MIKINYNPETGAILNAYDVATCVNIPEPNITVPDEEWAATADKIARIIGGELVTTDKPALVVRYSKLALIRALKSVNLWADVKAAIVAADAQDEWDAAVWLASDDPLFVSLKTTLGNAYPDTNIDALLANCLY